MEEAVFLTTPGASYFFNYGFLNDNTDNIDNGKNGDWLYGLKKTEIHPLKSMGALPWCLPSDFVL